MDTYMEHVQKEVVWYLLHGMHERRISRDSSGNKYVIGDFSWNRTQGNPVEYIESVMRRDLGRCQTL